MVCFFMVIDTGIFIEYLRAKNKSKTVLYQLPADAAIHVSAVSVYELYMGATTKEKEGHVSALLDNIPVLSFDHSVAEKAAEIFHVLKKQNQLIEFRDIFIGATALAYEFPLKTLNFKHFKRIPDLQLI